MRKHRFVLMRAHEVQSGDTIRIDGKEIPVGKVEKQETLDTGIWHWAVNTTPAFNIRNVPVSHDWTPIPDPVEVEIDLYEPD